MESEKKMSLFDAILLSVTVVLVVESVAPAAAIGASQFFWWILLLVGFFLPYGVISAELGTTYDSPAGLYDWVKRAYGKRNGGRVAWYYWVNYPLWMGSLAVLIPPIISPIIGIEFNEIVSTIIALVFIWFVTIASLSEISESQWILNVGAIFKAIIIISLGAVGIYFAVTQGVVNEFTVKTMTPSLDLNSLSYISVIIFNFLGFEVVAAMSDEMDNPQKEIPKAIVVGGVLIAVFYLFAAFGISAAIPFADLTLDTGLLDSFYIMLSSGANWFIAIIGLMFLFTLVSNIISWAYGVNSVAMYAGEDGTLPKIFKKKDEKTGMPTGAPILNGVVASILVIMSPVMSAFGLDDLFWSFFALNLITLLISYVFMFPAFLKLREIDGERERPYKVKGSDTTIKLMTYIPLFLLIVSLIFTAVPMNFSTEELATKGPIFIGTIIAIVLGEIVVSSSLKKNEKIKKQKIKKESGIQNENIRYNT